MTTTYRILIVDDSPEDDSVSRRFLSSGTNGQFLLDSASTGEEGLERATTDRPDCILLDYNLPDMTGIEFLESLPFLDGRPLMPVIMLTNQGSETLAVKAIKNGAEDFLVKGQITPSSLQVTVMGALTSATLHRSMREHRAHLNISQTLGTTDTLERVTPALLQEIGATMNWQICVLWAADSKNHTLSCLGYWHSPHLECAKFLESTTDTSRSFRDDLPGRAWATDRLIHYSELIELQNCPRFSLIHDMKICGAFAISFRSPHHDPIILECWYTHPRDVNPERFAMVHAIGKQVTQFLNYAHIERNLIRRESEYQLVTNHVPALLASFDAEGRYRLANQHYQDWFGVSEEDLLGKNQVDILGTEIYDQIFPFVDQALSGQRTAFEMQIPSPEGKSRWVQANCIPDETDSTGKISGYYFFASDITDRKHNEEHLRLQAQELARSNAELEEFAHIASHDLQEPLRKVQTFSDRLRTRCSEKLDGQELQYLERMHNATHRMQTLIRDLLTFSRVGKKTIPFQPVHLSLVVKDVLSDLETLITKTQATIHSQNLPVIEADPTHMRQLFQNLIGNAIKFHKPDIPPVIHIESFLDSSVSTSKSLPTWVITIRDNGIGFEQQYADRIFGVFQRLHGKDQYEGTGIGLSICKKVIERHQGRISVSSSPGQGTTFTLSLPAKELSGAPHDHPCTDEALLNPADPFPRPLPSHPLVNDPSIALKTIPLNQ